MYIHVFELHAHFLKALAHPRRLEIIYLLRDQELPVSDIHTMLDLPQANISQHLMILRDAGVVISRKDGKQIFYQLSDVRIIDSCDLIREILIDQNNNSDFTNEALMKMKDLVPIIQDPVCLMRVSPKTTGFHTHYKNQDYYFCASGCLKVFNKDPKKYVEK